ncbi:hypothetical protein H4R20_002752, partial [Coemansia guatemalensis]
NEAKQKSGISGTGSDVEMDHISSDKTTAETVDWSLSKVYIKEYMGFYQYDTTENGVEVDRTLICKALFGISAQVVRVCMPDGFGKSYNLNALLFFFNVPNRYDLPDLSMEVVYSENQLDEQTALDAAEAYRKRKSSMEESLLSQEAPAFFEKHFCRYPVILIRFM